jgi:hypothetical protein
MASKARAWALLSSGVFFFVSASAVSRELGCKGCDAWEAWGNTILDGEFVGCTRYLIESKKLSVNAAQ